MKIPGLGDVDLESIVAYGVNSCAIEQSRKQNEADSKVPEWMLNDTLQPAEKFPYFPSTTPGKEDRVKLAKTRAVPHFISNTYEFNNVSEFLLLSAAAACLFFESTGIATTDPELRAARSELTPQELEMKFDFPSAIFSDMVQLGIGCAHLAKIEWFRTGHHTSLEQCDGLVQRVIAPFVTRGSSSSYENNTKLAWHFSHYLDTRIACVHLGILEKFPGGPSYTTESDDFLKNIGAHIFPKGSGILRAADKVFFDLSKSGLAKYILPRLRDSYKQVEKDRAAFHPEAELLGKTRKYHTFTSDDEKAVCAIAHVIYSVPAMRSCRRT